MPDNYKYWISPNNFCMGKERRFLCNFIKLHNSKNELFIRGYLQILGKSTISASN